MNKDFSQYQRLIEKFRGKVLKADFESRFADTTSKILKSERFLLKMELKRLAAECTRLIDLRGLVDGDCRAYEHGDKVHFLDDVAIKVFEENISAYGSYTFGVYESVKNTENNFRVIYEREKKAISDPNYAVDAAPKPVLEKTQYPATFHQFGLYNNRIEERMNFAISILMTIAKQDPVKSTSSDISVYGCKIRLSPSVHLTVGDQVAMRFKGLEEEFHFGNNTSFTYQVKNIQLLDDIQLVGLKRVFNETEESKQAEETSHIDGFSTFLKGFIQGNKRRYKINLDNTIQSLKIRGIEHFSLPKINELPIFIDNSNGEMLPRYALTCPNNRSIYSYWQDESHRSTLNFLITPDRLKRLIKLNDMGESLLVYSFIHTSQGKHFFYTVDQMQLNRDPDFMPQLLSFMANKASFSVTQLSFIPVDEQLADFPFSISQELQAKEMHLNLPPSDEVMDAIKALPYIVVASNVTTSSAVSTYNLCDYANIEVSKLKAYGHKRLVDALIIDEVGIHYKNQRQEMRFKYKTPAIVQLPRADMEGFSHDFSMSGLKIELNKPSMLSKGEVVHLCFPALQKITSAFDLKNLPYEIIHINDKKTLINCRIYVEKHQHIGRNFFKLLIDKNRSKLEPDVHTLLTPGLGKALRNIYTSSLSTPSLMIQTSGSRYKVDAIVGSNPDIKLLSQMKELSDRKGFYNLYPLLSNSKVMEALNRTMKSTQRTSSPSQIVLYISIKRNLESVNKSINVRLESELSNAKQKEFFINNALKKGKFFCVKVDICRTLEPDMEYLHPELSYISSYAIHRGKQMEQDIWSIVGMMQLFDISQEVLFRHELLVKQQAEVS